MGYYSHKDKHWKYAKNLYSLLPLYIRSTLSGHTANVHYNLVFLSLVSSWPIEVYIFNAYLLCHQLSSKLGCLSSFFYRFLRKSSWERYLPSSCMVIKVCVFYTWNLFHIKCLTHSIFLEYLIMLRFILI
jgi:hypothetical protein